MTPTTLDKSYCYSIDFVDPIRNEHFIVAFTEAAQDKWDLMERRKLDIAQSLGYTIFVRRDEGCITEYKSFYHFDAYNTPASLEATLASI
jgi:hypothetical protein